jgi:hypothetical protein
VKKLFIFNMMPYKHFSMTWQYFKEERINEFYGDETLLPQGPTLYDS